LQNDIPKDQQWLIKLSIAAEFKDTGFIAHGWMERNWLNG
jgi:hypothetical protein